MDLFFQSKDETLFNITTQAHETKQLTQLLPTIIPLAILTFISAVTNFIFDAVNAIFHTFFYIFYDIEKVPDAMIQKLYKKSKILQDSKKRENYIRTMSIYTVDTFKKCWIYASAKKNVIP
ncbi:MAG: hypothetical protein HEEMFOPI_02028 [Holosporales bacterium]